MHRSNHFLTFILAAFFCIVIVLVAALPASGQNAVPPTARQAAALPEFASRLSRQVTPEAAGKRRAWVSGRSHRVSPQGGVIYDHGPVNGTVDAWTINYGYVVSDSISLGSGSTVAGFDFYTWEYPGDVLNSVDWSITSDPNGGTVYGSGTANVKDTYISTNQYGYNIDHISASGLNVSVGGTAWLNLQNAAVPSGDPVFWDENSGQGCHSQGCPSQAYETSVGTIPSEAFDVTGNGNGCFYNKDGFTIIHDFTAEEQSPNGSSLAIDQTGKLYGTTAPGGDNGLGLAYQLAPSGQDWIFTPLYSFTGGYKGQSPGTLVLGPEGALYGVADGGNKTCGSSGNAYCGLVYRLRPSPVACLTALCSWSEEVLYRFTGDPDGWQPLGSPVFDQAGNLYGVTFEGGANGWGTVYELTPSNGSWSEKVLYSFTGGSNGGGPSLLLLGQGGNLYGTTGYGGGDGDGVIFQLVPSGDSWEERVLWNFGPAFCARNLIDGRSGSFYGTDCYQVYQCYLWGCNWNDFGTIFKMSPSGDGWQFSTFYDIYWDYYHGRGLQDFGFDVFNDLAIHPAGDLYATESWSICCFPSSSSIFKLPQPHQEQTLVEFDVYTPLGVPWSLDAGASGNLYGTTAGCGKYGYGTAWQLTPP